MKKRYLNLCTMALCFTFLVGIKNGRVAIWEDDDPEPIKILPYSTALLPREARQALTEGIRVESLEELYELAEKYLS